MRHSSWKMHLGLAAGVDEDQRGLVALDQRRRSRRAHGARNGPAQGRRSAVSSMVTSGAAPPSASTRSASAARRSVCGTRIAAQIVGLGDRRREADAGELRRERETAAPARARADRRASTSPAHAVRRARRAAACRTDTARPAMASSSASCSGVVSRMSGGSRRWRWRFEAGVSPVRVSMRIGSPISATGVSRLRAMSTASALSGEM